MPCWQELTETGARTMAAVTSSHAAMVTLPTDTQILITREFDAPRHLVYRAWTTPELIKRWWSGDRGKVTIAEVDLRLGGAWRYVMTANGGFEVAFHGEYREIVRRTSASSSTEIFEGARTPSGGHGHVHREGRPHDPHHARPARQPGAAATRTSTPAWRTACRRRWTTSSRSRSRCGERFGLPHAARAPPRPAREPHAPGRPRRPGRASRSPSGRRAGRPALIADGALGGRADELGVLGQHAGS